MSKTINIEALREALVDYFGSAMGVNFLMAVSGVEEVKSASAQRLIEIAKECGIDVNCYTYNDNDFDR